MKLIFLDQLFFYLLFKLNTRYIVSDLIFKCHLHTKFHTSSHSLFFHHSHIYIVDYVFFCYRNKILLCKYRNIKFVETKSIRRATEMLFFFSTMTHKLIVKEIASQLMRCVVKWAVKCRHI